MELLSTIQKGARISECGNYRYSLWRIWDETKPLALFVMLNPSTADEEIDDPTIRRCVNFAKAWGYGGLYVCNLYAYRATNPKKLKEVEDPEGENNRDWIAAISQRVEMIVCAWGNNQGQPPEWMFDLCGDLHYLEAGKDGTPKHPLYLRKDLQPKLYSYI